MEKNLDILVSKELQRRKYEDIETSNTLIAGAMAGVLSKTAIAPLDRAKINFQVRNVRFTYRDCIRFVIDSIRMQGFLSLYRGNMSQVLRVAPAAAINYTAFRQWCKLFRVDQIRRNTGKTFICGALSGVTATVFTYPLDLMRARMAVMDKAICPSVISGFANVLKYEGVRGLYRGIIPTMIGSVPYYGFGYTTYVTLKLLNKELFNDANPNKLKRLVFGGIAGLIGQTSSYPIDVVRRRLQTASIFNNAVTNHSSAFQVFIVIFHSEGVIRGLYKGLTVNWIKGPISVGISFTTFDTVKNWLDKVRSLGT